MLQHVPTSGCIKPMTRTTGIALLCLAALLWGTWPLYLRAGGGPTGVSLAFLSMFAMALPAPFVIRRRDFLDRGAVAALVIIGLCDAANAVLYFSALQRGPVVVATLTHYLAPLLVALTAPLLVGEPRSRRATIAAPIILVGLALVLGRAGETSSWQTTAALGGGSAIFYAGLVLASRRAGQTFTPLAVTSLHAVVSAIALALVFRAEVLPPAFDARFTVAFAGCLVNGLFAAVLFNTALQRVGAQLTGVLTYLEPLAASLLGIAIFGEPFGVLTFLGTALVLGTGAWSALERA